MAHEFKAGDLALIIGSSKGTSPNVGKCVSLVARIRTDEEYVAPDGKQLINRGPNCWVVEAPDLVATLKAGGHIDVGGIALVMEKYLIPLRGDFNPEQLKAKEAEPCA